VGLLKVILNLNRQPNLPNCHIPVMLPQVLDFLPSQREVKGNVFDGTFGGGGYSQQFLKQGWLVFACDLDWQAIEDFWKRNPELKEGGVDNGKQDNNSQVPSSALSRKGNQLHLKQSNFADYIQTFEDNFFAGIVLDLGFSSNQLETGGRGFSHRQPEEVLDLRYAATGGQPAWRKIQNLGSAFELQKVLYTYSGESCSRQIAQGLWNYAQTKLGPLSVGEAVSAISNILPASQQTRLRAILSRVWQALRIWVNDEFASLKKFLPIAAAKLAPGGRLIIVSFHSLEDKIVTKFMRSLARPQNIDDFGNKRQAYKLLTPKGVLPDEAQVESNPRSRSAVLRVLERVEGNPVK